MTGVPDVPETGGEPVPAEAAGQAASGAADPVTDPLLPAVEPEPAAGAAPDPDPAPDFPAEPDFAAEPAADASPGLAGADPDPVAGPGPGPAAETVLDLAGQEPGPAAERPTDPGPAGAGVAAGKAAGPARAMAGKPSRLPNGHMLSGRYRLTRRIAAGGMGEVWRAEDELLGRQVAIKLLSAAHSSDEQFRERFRGEARYAASLSHPGIARVYDYGESAAEPGGDWPETGLAYLVMELVDGEPLSAALARDGRMPAAAALDLVAQAARALAVAHAAGIAHRDIKPGNLLLTQEGQVKITDFGIARAVLAAHLTQTGMVIGTAQYVSPEQASARPITTATDIYSLGVVAYECLAGRPPFTADTAIALALAHVNDRPPPLPGDVPPQVAALVGQMLAKEPANRPASAQMVADRATALAEDTSLAGENGWIIGSAESGGWFADPALAGPAPAHPGTAPMAGATGRRPRSRRSAALILTTGAAVAAVAAGTIAILAASRHPASASPPASSSSAGAHHSATRPDLSGATGQPGYLDQGAPSPRPKPAPTTPSKSPSPTPSRSPTSSPTPSSPSSTSTPPPTSPPPTGTPTPTPTPTTPTPAPTGTATVGTATTAAAQGMQVANIETYS
jgi:serine/threonine-protein kinase